MDVKYINPFIQSTMETFQKMMNTEVSPGKPILKSASTMKFDVSGIIGLSGEAQGSIAICFPKVVALKTVSAMLGMSVKVVGEEVRDGVGEIANIIAGYAKQYLHEYSVTISLPKIIMGNGHVVTNIKGVPAFIVPFESALGVFAMEVALVPGK
ncbi:MAG: chemotaxis protein CheX [Chitinivibrionales bacterium]|nr:chemotaxis protein CheX [Chitinivibrionales bacterium]